MSDPVPGAEATGLVKTLHILGHMTLSLICNAPNTPNSYAIKWPGHRVDLSTAGGLATASAGRDGTDPAAPWVVPREPPTRPITRVR